MPCRSRPLAILLCTPWPQGTSDDRRQKYRCLMVPRCIRVACTATSQKVPPSESNSPGRDSLQHAAPVEFSQNIRRTYIIYMILLFLVFFGPLHETFIVQQTIENQCSARSETILG